MTELCEGKPLVKNANANKNKKINLRLCHIPVWYFANVSDAHAGTVQLALPSVVDHRDAIISAKVYILAEIYSYVRSEA